MFVPSVRFEGKARMLLIDMGPFILDKREKVDKVKTDAEFK